MTSTPDSIEGIIIVAVRWVKLGVEIFGAGLVTLGVCAAGILFTSNLRVEERLGQVDRLRDRHDAAH